MTASSNGKAVTAATEEQRGEKNPNASLFSSSLLKKKKGEETTKNATKETQQPDSGGGKAAVQDKTKPMTKRQRRKQVNNANKWPQQPRIASAETRAKAYIRVSGLTQTLKDKEQISPELDLHSPAVRFGRLLGNPDQRIRHKAVLQLQNYLKARCDIPMNQDIDVPGGGGGLSELDLLKLWKGLWHTLYMADKTPVQEELNEKLANLIWCVSGTEEQDEYAGQMYLKLCANEAAFDVDDDEEDENDDDEDEDYNGEEDDNDEDEEEEDEEDDKNDNKRGEMSDDDDAEERDEEDDDDDGKGRCAVINGERVKVVDMEDDDDDEDEQEEDDNGKHDDDNHGSLSEAEIPHCRGAHLASLFLKTFLRTVRREWGRMDKYRVDKFYSLIRKMVHQVFRYMALRHWNLGVIRLFNDAIFEEILSQTPNGLRYHFIDLALEELAKVNRDDAPLALTEATFVDCLEPYFGLAQTGAGDDTVQRRVVEKILEPFLMKYSFVSPVAQKAAEDNDNEVNDDQADAKSEKKLVFDNVHVGSIAEFIFDVASDPETRDIYRKSLYDLHKQYMRRIKAVGKDVAKSPDGTGALDEEEMIEDEEMEALRDSGLIDDDDDEYDNMDDNEDEEDDGDDDDVEKIEHDDDDDDSSNRLSRKRKMVGSSKQQKEHDDDANPVATTVEQADMGTNTELKEEKKKKPRKRKKKQGGVSVEKEEDAIGGQPASKPVETSSHQHKNKPRLSEDSAESTEKSESDADDKQQTTKKTQNKLCEESAKSSSSDSAVALDGKPNEEQVKSKKKKKKKKRKSSLDSTESHESTEDEGEEQPRKKTKTLPEHLNEADAEKKKGNKNNEKQTQKIEKEEEVVISVSEQKKAKATLDDEKKAKLGNHSATITKDNKKKAGNEELISPDATKRVKFGPVVSARSYKASMKALRNASPKTPPATPEQSILLKKEAKNPVINNNKNNGNNNNKTKGPNRKNRGA